MNVVKIVGAIPLIALGIFGVYALTLGEGRELPWLCVAIGALTPGICLLIVGIKNFAGIENPVADTIAVGASLIVAIVCALAFALLNPGGEGDQSKDNEGGGLVLYSGEISEERETKDDIKGKGQIDEKINGKGQTAEKQQAVIKKEEPTKKTKSAEITKKEEIKNLDKDNKKPAASKKEVISKDTSEKKEAKPEEPKSEEAKPEEEIEESIDPAKIRAIPDAKGVNIVNESSSEDWEDITVTFNTNRTSYKVKIDYLAKGQSYYVLNASLQAADGTYFDNGLETFQNMSTYIRISHGKNKTYYDTYL